jgi:ferredoxin
MSFMHFTHFFRRVMSGASINPQDPMAQITDRLPQNVPGRFYVDSSCIDCGLCPSTAPAHFRRDDETGQSFVFKQPVTEQEIILCREALESCPTESIGDEEQL